MNFSAALSAAGLNLRMAFKLRVFVAVSLIAGAIFAIADGVTAAAEAGSTAKSVDAAAITLAGRWTGPRYAYNMRAPNAEDCGGKPCTLTYDIVACPEGWCGIAVTDATPCGPIAVYLKQETASNRRNGFTGKLELANGSAPYTVEAWYNADGASNGSEHAHLNFVGDTGGELLMMRRSFPFQAELARISDAQCTLDKATS